MIPQSAWVISRRSISWPPKGFSFDDILSGLNRQNDGLICGGVIYRKPFLVFLWTYDNPDVAGIETALTRRVFYNGVGHYQALVEVGPNPAGWKPAWEQPPPPIYFTETEKNTAPAPPAAMPLKLAIAAKQPNCKTIINNLWHHAWRGHPTIPHSFSL